jgi:hypothetical protein
MSAGIFLRRGDELIAMTEQAYATESVLQELVAAHPTLLSGDGVAHRWLLVSREVGVASESGGGDRWSVDHLFLDERGTPTLVEVKRSTDTRIRREVVGQMLDYAANALAYWSLADIRARFAAQCERRGESDETRNRRGARARGGSRRALASGGDEPRRRRAAARVRR